MTIFHLMSGRTPKAALSASAPSPARLAQSAAATDAELVARAVTGDDAAFEAIMRRHNRLLFRTARAVLKVDADAEDALQDAYLRAWRALPTFRSESKLSTWLVPHRRQRGAGPAAAARRAGDPSLDGAVGTADPQIEPLLEDDPDGRPEGAAMRADVRRRASGSTQSSSVAACNPFTPWVTIAAFTPTGDTTGGMPSAMYWRAFIPHLPARPLVVGERHEADVERHAGPRLPTSARQGMARARRAPSIAHASADDPQLEVHLRARSRAQRRRRIACR